MRRTADRAAVSLAEVVLAIGLLVVCLMPLASLFSLTTAQTVKSRNYLLAQHLASNLFELYRVKANAVLKVAQGDKPRKAADLLADKDVRQLLTGGAKQIEDVITFSKMKMALELETSVDGKIGLDKLVTTIEWEEDGSKRSRTYGRITAP
jgi:Tfp pilus assembly protein PilV